MFNNELEEFRKRWLLELVPGKQNDNSNSINEDDSLKLFINNILPLKRSNECRLDQENNYNKNEFENKYSIEVADQPLKKIKKSNSLLEILLNDLNEINDIPFFDITLPREVALKIFRHLDMKDLCSCAQVSRSWRSLAEDQLLWHKICQDLGFTKMAPPCPNWKQFVQESICNQRTLQCNWKNRSGKLYELEDVHAGILSAAATHQGFVIAGYSQGVVNLWDQDSSNTQLLHREEDPVHKVDISSSFLAAAFNSGYLYISPRDEAESMVLVKLEGPPQLLATENAVHAAWRSCLHSWNQQGHHSLLHLPSPSVHHLASVPGSSSLVAVDSQYVRLVQPPSYTDLHPLLDSSVSCLGCSSELLALGLFAPSFFHLFQVTVLSVTTGQVVETLSGHTSGVLFAQLPSPHLVLTGCRDKRVRLFDLRCGSEAELTLAAHSMGVTCGQLVCEDLLTTGGEDGLVCAWDLKAPQHKLWEANSPHPVRLLAASSASLVTAHIPSTIISQDYVVHKSERGSLYVYDFSAQPTVKSIPAICLSSYDEPAGYNYNIRLAVPYDQILDPKSM